MVFSAEDMNEQFERVSISGVKYRGRITAVEFVKDGGDTNLQITVQGGDYPEDKEITDDQVPNPQIVAQRIGVGLPNRDSLLVDRFNFDQLGAVIIVDKEAEQTLEIPASLILEIRAESGLRSEEWIQQVGELWRAQD
jgi:hypothetical protein